MGTQKSLVINQIAFFPEAFEPTAMADIDEKIAKVFDLYDKHGNELYFGNCLSILVSHDLNLLVGSQQVIIKDSISSQFTWV